MKSSQSPLAAIRATRATLLQMDRSLAQMEAEVRRHERVESVWRQATQEPRREVCHGRT